MSILRLAIAVLRRDWSLETDISISDVIDAAAVDRRRPDEPRLVICNYLSGLSVADALTTRDRQLLILHDWTEARPARRVLEALQTNRHRLALNAEEARQITGVFPLRQCLVGLPFEKSRVQTGSFDTPPATASIAIQMSQPDHETFVTPETSLCDGLTTDIFDDKPIDLLFVGGSHSPNQTGINAFVRDCFAPYLASRGISLVIAGSVGRRLAFEDIPGVRVTGRVRDLTPLYASARLVIVPLLSGTGISIKTLEAIAMNKAVLSTPVGLRGLDAAEDAALSPPFDERWADRILRLLGSPDLLAEHQAAMLMLTGAQSLGEAIEKVLEPLLSRVKHFEPK